MTNHYLDFRIELAEENTGETSHLLARIWQRLHGVLSNHKIRHLGISLPAIRKLHPGNVLRLHSDAATLQQIITNDSIQQLLEFGGVRALKIYPTPAYCEYRRFTRSRLTEKYTDAGILRSEKRLLTHLDKKEIAISSEQLLARRKRLQERSMQVKADNVYIRLHSTSTHQIFSLLVQADTPTTKVSMGLFSYYGLAVGESSTVGLASVPWFE